MPHCHAPSHTLNQDADNTINPCTLHTKTGRARVVSSLLFPSSLPARERKQARGTRSLPSIITTLPSLLLLNCYLPLHAPSPHHDRRPRACHSDGALGLGHLLLATVRGWAGKCRPIIVFLLPARPRTIRTPPVGHDDEACPSIQPAACSVHIV